jgi:hypothetical protein
MTDSLSRKFEWEIHPFEKVGPIEARMGESEIVALLGPPRLRRDYKGGGFLLAWHGCVVEFMENKAILVELQNAHYVPVFDNIRLRGSRARILSKFENSTQEGELAPGVFVSSDDGRKSISRVCVLLSDAVYDLSLFEEI